MQQAGDGLEKIVAASLRRAAPGEGPILAWPITCGSGVAERTRPLDFVDGILRVEVADYGWQKELRALASQYLAVINRYVSEPVHRIEFVIAGSEKQAMRKVSTAAASLKKIG
jgi:predicted nucleic acid-binding Zn ribbon protein